MTKPNFAYWESVFFPERPDVIIIGAGIVGLSCALSLIEYDADLQILVLEALPVSRGASTRNAGFACFGSPSELLADLRDFPEDKVFRTVQDRFRGLEKLLTRVGRQHIDFEQTDGQEVFFDRDRFDVCADQLDYLNRQISSVIGEQDVYQVAPVKGDLIGEYYTIRINGEGYLHPGKMIHQLEKICTAVDIKIMKGVEVTSVVQKDEVAQITLSNGYKLHAPHCCICTNGFHNHISENLDVQPARNQVILSEPLANNPLHGTYHHHEGFVYWRNVDNRILIGGMRHLNKTGETTAEFGMTDEIVNALKQFVSDHIYTEPIEYEYQWSGIIGLGKNKQPIIKKISPSIVAAIRLGGMGIAIGASVGEEAARLTVS